MPRPGGRLLDLLVEHGVPERPARVYLAACREGPQTAAELARVAGLNRVEAYRLVRQLDSAGLLRTSGRRPMRFVALPPEALVDRWIKSATASLRTLESDRERMLKDLTDSLTEVEPADTRKFTVLEGWGAIHRFIARRIGTAKREVRLVLPGAILGHAMEGGIDRALKEAGGRGVKVRLVTEVTVANHRSDAKELSSFCEARHVPGLVSNGAVSIDRAGALVFVSDPEGVGTSDGAQVALWSAGPGFLHAVDEVHRRLWKRGAPVGTRLVELDEHGSAALPVSAGREKETFDRLREIASLGMRATGVSRLQLDLPELIEAIARPLGRQIAEELDGETPDGVARGLAEFYERHALGRLEVVRARPLTLRVRQCFACVQQSPELGRVLCPGLLKAAFEARLGGSCDVSKPDPRRHAERGCLFTVALR